MHEMRSLVHLDRGPSSMAVSSKSGPAPPRLDSTNTSLQGILASLHVSSADPLSIGICPTSSTRPPLTANCRRWRLQLALRFPVNMQSIDTGLTIGLPALEITPPLVRLGGV